MDEIDFTPNWQRLGLKTKEVAQEHIMQRLQKDAKRICKKIPETTFCWGDMQFVLTEDGFE